MLSTPVGRLRAVSALEGLSYLLLLGVAMPLKYLAGIPEVVRVVGMAHGVLFVVFVSALIAAAAAERWSVGRSLVVLGLSLVPFGALQIERTLRPGD